MPAGRPSDYTEDKAATICALLAEGKSLRSICLADDMPDMGNILNSSSNTHAREKIRPTHWPMKSLILLMIQQMIRF